MDPRTLYMHPKLIEQAKVVYDEAGHDFPTWIKPTEKIPVADETSEDSTGGTDGK